MLGVIVKIVSDSYTVKHYEDCIECRLRGRMRRNKIVPLVGDQVIFDLDSKVILNILPRHHELIRPAVCNIGQALIVVSVKEPALDLYLLDKLLLIITHQKIKPIICFTKMDLLTFKEKREFKQYLKYYQKWGYLVYTNLQLKKLKMAFKNKITVLAGASGVGKSTLLNKLDHRLELKTDEVSVTLKRGKHTTRHVELFSLGDGLVADTPGFTALELVGMTKDDVRKRMVEFEQYRHLCEYRNCFHQRGNNCEIKRMVAMGQILKSRYQNYLKFLKEIREGKKW